MKSKFLISVLFVGVAAIGTAWAATGGASNASPTRPDKSGQGMAMNAGMSGTKGHTGPGNMQGMRQMMAMMQQMQAMMSRCSVAMGNGMHGAAAPPRRRTASIVPRAGSSCGHRDGAPRHSLRRSFFEVIARGYLIVPLAGDSCRSVCIHTGIAGIEDFISG